MADQDRHTVWPWPDPAAPIGPHLRRCDKYRYPPEPYTHATKRSTSTNCVRSASLSQPLLPWERQPAVLFLYSLLLIFPKIINLAMSNG